MEFGPQLNSAVKTKKEVKREIKPYHTIKFRMSNVVYGKRYIIFKNIKLKNFQI